MKRYEGEFQGKTPIEAIGNGMLEMKNKYGLSYAEHTTFQVVDKGVQSLFNQKPAIVKFWYNDEIENNKSEINNPKTINCPDCDGIVSKLAESCPHCGRPMKATSTKSVSTPLIKCIHCGSTNVTTGARGINGFWGAIGASKTVNRCGNCGKVWKP